MIWRRDGVTAIITPTCYSEWASLFFCIAQYPVRLTAQSALHFTPWQTCSFRHQPDFCPHPGTHLYSSLNWGIMETTKMPGLRNGRKGIRTGLSRSRVRHSTAELPHRCYDVLYVHFITYLNPFTAMSNGIRIQDRVVQVCLQQ